jgi:hypothetical protein
MCRNAILLLALAVAAFPVAGQQQAYVRTRHTASASTAKSNRTQTTRSAAASRLSSIAPLRGSLSNLKRQDKRLRAEELEPIEDNRDLAGRIKNHLLVPLPVSAALTADPDLEKSRRYCRPWTATYLSALARDHRAAFHSSLEVSSAVRTVAYQKQLKRTNSNAAPAEGTLFSPHVMGATVDIAKGDLSRAEVLWLRRRLRADAAAGKIDVEEEFEQACFHITVYKPAAQPSSTRTQAQLQIPALGSRPQSGKGTATSRAGNRDRATARQTARSQATSQQAHMDLLY